MSRHLFANTERVFFITKLVVHYISGNAR